MIHVMRLVRDTLIAGVGYLALAIPAFAISHTTPTPTPGPTGTIVTCPPGQFNALCNLRADNFGVLLGTIVTFAFVGAILIALAFLIYGGLKWIVSGGDKTAIEEARNHIVSAVVGLVIVFLVYFILNLIIYFFTGNNLFQITIPTLPK